MIQAVRIDDRLLHGQVAYSWKAKFNYQAIVIADDEVDNDEMRKSIIKMAVPSGVKLAIKNINNAIELLNNPKLKSVNVFVIVSNPKSAYDILNGINEKTTLNIGGMMKKDGTREFSKAVFMSDDDISWLDKIYELGIDIDVRQTPNESNQDYKTLRDKF